jgi:hypothetical protein
MGGGSISTPAFLLSPWITSGPSDLDFMAVSGVAFSTFLTIKTENHHKNYVASQT